MIVLCIPGEPLPWWLKEDYVRLCYTNRENDTPIELTLYALGYWLTVLAGILLLQMVQERSTQLPPNQRNGQILTLVLFEAVLAAIAFAFACFFPKTHPVPLRIASRFI